MTRTTRYKLGYAVVLGVLGMFSVIAIGGPGGGWTSLLIVLACLMVPRRVQGWFYRDLFQGRRRLEAGHPAEAVPYFERFLTLVRAQPWRKRLLWLSWPVYTPDAEAMMLNNLGATHLALGQATEAEQALQEALEIDPLYPLPHFNLALLQELRGNRDLAEQMAAKAAELGYAHSTVDAIIYQAQSFLAHFEGYGQPAAETIPLETIPLDKASA